MSEIHSTALVASGARIGQGGRIGPFCIIGPDVKLGDNVIIHSHVVVTGHTTIGAGTQVFPFAALGLGPQDKRCDGRNSRLEIGENNIIREHVTMHPGTEHGGLVTRVGNDCMFMVGSHVAHDCAVGNGVLFTNGATLGGHCRVEDHVILGGMSAVHQFVRIGAFAFVGGMSGIENDVIPYGMAMGNRAALSGLNIVGLKRRGVPRAQIHKLRKAYRLLFSDQGTLSERVREVEQTFGDDEHVRRIVDFIKAPSDRALCVPKMKGKAL